MDDLLGSSSASDSSDASSPPESSDAAPAKRQLSVAALRLIYGKQRLTILDLQ